MNNEHDQNSAHEAARRGAGQRTINTMHGSCRGAVSNGVRSEEIAQICAQRCEHIGFFSGGSR
jgi:hypothetical protein